MEYFGRFFVAALPGAAIAAVILASADGTSILTPLSPMLLMTAMFALIAVLTDQNSIRSAKHEVMAVFKDALKVTDLWVPLSLVLFSTLQFFVRLATGKDLAEPVAMGAYFLLLMLLKRHVVSKWLVENFGAIASLSQR